MLIVLDVSDSTVEGGRAVSVRRVRIIRHVVSNWAAIIVSQWKAVVVGRRSPSVVIAEISGIGGGLGSVPIDCVLSFGGGNFRGVLDGKWCDQVGATGSETMESGAAETAGAAGAAGAAGVTLGVLAAARAAM